MVEILERNDEICGHVARIRHDELRQALRCMEHAADILDSLPLRAYGLQKRSHMRAAAVALRNLRALMQQRAEQLEEVGRDGATLNTAEQA